MALNEQILINFLKDKVGFEEFDGDTPLFSSGYLDSVSQMDLIMFIENSSRVVVDQIDVTLENFDSVNRIVKYAEDKERR